MQTLLAIHSLREDAPRLPLKRGDTRQTRLPSNVETQALQRATTTVKTQRYKQTKAKQGSVQEVRDRATTQDCAVYMCFKC